MSDKTLGTLKDILGSLLDETDDADVKYKLRTALQLIEVHQSDLNRLEEAADSDSELHERLHDLGYLD